MKIPPSCGFCYFKSKCKNRKGIDFAYGGLECLEMRKDVKEILTEEQFRMIAPYINVYSVIATHGLSSNDIESTIHDLKQIGFISRSELEISISESEELLSHCFDDLRSNNHVTLSNNQICTFKHTIALLKKDHPWVKNEN